MKFKDAQGSIYDFLSAEHLSRISEVKFQKNVVFLPAIPQDPLDLYYILEGGVTVFSQAYNGRRFLIDELGKDDFIGKFSYMRGQEWYCEVETSTPCRMLKLTEIKEDLFQNDKFSLFFLIKTTNRVYKMYKRSVAQMLFSYKELLAYHLLSAANKEGFISTANANICLTTNISERQYYYLMEGFDKNGLICRDKKGIYIRDTDGLKATAAKVTQFMFNEI